MRIPKREESISLLLGQNWRVEAYNSIDSTMNRGKILATENLDSPFVVISEEQALGRGRQGRGWISPRGGFYATFGLKHSVNARHTLGLSLVAGLCVCSALSLEPHEVCLKWPNDLLSVDGQKLGGILIEILSVDVILIGIGLNRFDCPLKDESTSLKLVREDQWEVDIMAAKIGCVLKSSHDVFLTEGFKVFKARWLEYCNFLGSELTVDMGGGRVLNGLFFGINDEGAMLIQTEKKVVSVYSGHILEVKSRCSL